MRFRRERLVHLLLERGADINAPGPEGWTPLIWAAWYGDVDGVAWAIQLGADVNAAPHEGKTALHLARAGRAFALERNDAERVARKEAIIELLVRAGAKD